MNEAGVGNRGVKLLHMSVHHNLPVGVFHQMRDEHRASRELGADIQWDTRVFAAVSPESGAFLTRIRDRHVRGRMRRLKDYVCIRRMAFSWLVQHADEYDFVLVRHGLADAYEWAAARRIDNWISVHHTWEPDEATLMGGVRGWLFNLLEQYLGSGILSRVRAVVGVTGELGRMEIGRLHSLIPPVLVYPNGIDLTTTTLAPDRRGGRPRLLFLSSVFASWHGLEELITALRSSNEDFVLDVVGRTFPEQERLAVGDPRIQLHGVQQAGYIHDLISRSDIGLSSFALEKKGMSEACTLKVREYLAAGLPVCAGHRDAGMPDSFPYYRQYAPQSVDAILAYAAEMREIQRETVRISSAPYIDKRALMRRLVAQIAAHLDGWKRAT